MGVDLRLFPVDFLSTENVRMSSGPAIDKKWGYSHTILDVPRQQSVWPAVQKLPATSLAGYDITGFLGQIIPDGKAEGEMYYGKYTTDPYGAIYKMVTAGNLGPVLRKHFPDHPTTAYVNAMPPDGLIILGWH